MCTRQEDGVTPELPQAIQESQGVAFVEQVDNIVGFADMMYQHGGQYHLVGFPTDQDCGNYWNSEYYVVVNRDTRYREKIWEYRELLETAVPHRESAAEIGEIILEELGSYYSEDKDAQSAASMIQDRVQLYLSEQQ